jgi:hypothetical protein
MFDNGKLKHEDNVGNEDKAARKTTLNLLFNFITFMFKQQLTGRINQNKAAETS